MMNFKYILPALLLSLFFSISAIAQDTEKNVVKKATIIKKTIDEQGNETVEKIILKGDEVDTRLKEIDLNNDQVEKVEVIKDSENANIWITKKGERIKLENQDSNIEDIRIYQFDGDGISTNEGNIDVNVNHQNGEKIITITQDGVEKVIKIDNSAEHFEEINDGEHRIIVLDSGNEEIEVEVEDIRIADSNKPFLGIMMNINVDKDDHGGGDIISTTIITLDPVPNSPAENAGILKGDVLFSIDDVTIDDIDDVTNLIKTKKIGDVVNVKVIRSDEEKTISIKLGERPKKEFDFKQLSKEELFLRGLDSNGKPTGKRPYYGNWDRKHHHKNFRKTKRDPCKPFIGFSSKRDLSEIGGLEILSIIKNTPAEREGLLPGDIVLEMDGQKISDHKELITIRDRHDTGDRFKLLINRNGKKIKIRSSFNDCPEGKEVEEIIDIETELIGMAEDYNSSLRVYPNPTKGEFNLAYNGKPGQLNISISDISGKILYQKNINNFQGAIDDQINLSEFADGTILIKIENEGEILIEKLIIQPEH